ncbi:hypothetical protein NDU88_004240 [Pleurodeles waltl]|uniref:Uncharacterized protein n=1 Tax=Pleurodeles waltl TaxID=8319 RepID=A0AAV7TRX1_PLEWA|nr:hypothetical protein NDU88_004240 [Pleurodeles waltl]
MMGQERRNPCMGRVAEDPEGQRKCILQHAEVPDAIVPAVEAELLFARMCVCGPDDWCVLGVLKHSPDLNLAIEWERRLFHTSGP